ncbi:sensor histidine kinase [Candidatus Leptofilum sp.]|uniref:GAF domain-containing sensor histidine kinase n=1 Tax=Candidatus Leptofilum sp. TaxID=3241576 RepID=UPI003B5C8BF0
MSEATLTLLIQLFFWGLTLLALAALAQFRNRVRLDIALVMLSISLALTPPNWYRTLEPLGQALSTLAVVAHPFLLLRVVQHFRQIRPYILRLALLGMVISGAILLLVSQTNLLALFVLAYFIGVEGFAVVAFFQAARANSGVSRWRLILVALGILTLLLAIVTFLPFRQFFAANTTFSLLPTSLTLIAGGAFYLGFAPPRWLRKYWQLRELNQFLHHVPAQYADMELDRVVQYLCLAAHRSVDSITAVAAMLDPEDQQLHITPPENLPELGNITIPATANRLGQLWLERGPFFATTPGDLGQIGLELIRIVNAKGLLTIPIATPVNPYGLLIVLCRQTPLFVDDDLDLLSLLTAQTARTLSYSHLLKSERKARNQAETLAHIAAELSANIELEQTLAVVCQETMTALDCSFTAVFTLDTTTQTYSLRHGVGQITAIKQVESPLPPAHEPTFATRTQPLLLEPIQAAPDWPDATRLEAANIHSLAYAPLAYQGELLGLLAIGAIGEAEPISEADLVELQAIADQAVMAIQNGRLYREVQLANDELEDRVAQRTADLQQRNEELDAFAHTVAHDLKMPISHMVGLAETMTSRFEDLPPTDRQKYLEIIQQSGHKMASIIDALLLLAGVREMEVPIAPLEMSIIVDEARQRLAHLNRQYGVTVTLPEVWPVAMGYAPWVEEIWVNYLSNGIKYGGHPPKLTLGATAVANDMIKFWIQDNGIGIAPEAREQLFVPFTQLNLRQDSGYGLGLSIVQRIVERLGGEVGAETLPNQGGYFWFTLPVATESALAQPNIPTPHILP